LTLCQNKAFGSNQSSQYLSKSSFDKEILNSLPKAGFTFKIFTGLPVFLSGKE
jgi:hypothetical protein